MSITKKDLQAIEGIVQGIVQVTVQSSEIRLKTFIKEFVTEFVTDFVRSEFRIQNKVLDTRFRELHTKLDTIEIQTSKRFQIVESYLQIHHAQIQKLGSN